jgi:hypothetical protein
LTAQTPNKAKGALLDGSENHREEEEKHEKKNKNRR